VSTADVAIVDFGLGNLFSIKHACEHIGLTVAVTSSAEEVEAARSVILPGVGAFADAMESLRALGLVEPLRETVRSGKPFLGICLGLQLLFSQSEEFGIHPGLDIVPGQVVYFPEQKEGGRQLKVPEVGWNEIHPPADRAQAWDATLLHGLPAGVPMYFVHSCYVIPEDAGLTLCQAGYGQVRFCAGIARGNVTAFQFHPERSGPDGLRIYANFKKMIKMRSESR
jgi:glutamine amidotransferase